MIGGVAQRERRRVPVAFAHQRRQAGQQHAGPAWSRIVRVAGAEQARAPPLATATMRNAVSESFSGIVTLRIAVARRAATRAFQTSSVSNSSRARSSRAAAAAAVRHRLAADSAACRPPASAPSRSTPRGRARPSSHRAGSSSHSAQDRAAPRRPPRCATSLPAGSGLPSARGDVNPRRCALFADLVDGARRLHLHIQPMRRPADLDLRDAESIGAAWSDPPAP